MREEERKSKKRHSLCSRNLSFKFKINPRHKKSLPGSTLSSQPLLMMDPTQPMTLMPSEEGIKELASLASATQGAPSDVPEASWRAAAKLALMELPHEPQQRRINLCIHHFQRTSATNEPSGLIVPPPIAETVASSLNDDTPANREKKRKFDEEVLPRELRYGHFVRIPSYLAFVESLVQSKPLNERAQQVLEQDVGFWCPKRNVADATKETPRSTNLARALSIELMNENVSVVHQVPILPDMKQPDKQDVDLAIFVDNGNWPGHIGALVEYKPLPKVL